MAFECLVDCVKKYDRRGVRKPINLAVMMPWVEIRIIGGGKQISVGNYSSKETKAVIKSFQFGQSNGVGCFIEIVDEEGGNFDNFFNKIVIGNMDSAFGKYFMKARFGWAYANCLPNGSFAEGTRGATMCTPYDSIGYNGPMMSCEHTLWIKNISINVANGAYKYSIECQDQTMDNFTSRLFRVYGPSGKQIRLVEAIKLCLGEIGIEPVFLQLDSGRPVPFKFSVVGDVHETLGPIGTWSTLGRDPISACRDWLDSYSSKRKKGIVLFFHPINKNQLVFMETSRVTCEEKPDFSAMNMGTYILNGGNCLAGFNRILTEKGYRKISNIVTNRIECKVACVDQFGDIKYKKITDWHLNKRNGRKFYRLKLTHAKGKGGVVMTEDHKVLTKHGWKVVANLDKDDKIHSGTTRPSKEMHEAIVGLLCGHGTINKRSVLFHRDFENVFLSAGPITVTDRYFCIRKITPYMRWMKKIYGKEEFFKDFTMISLAFLFMDSGRVLKKEGRMFIKKRSEEVMKKMKELGINCYKREENSCYIYISKDSTDKILDAIEVYKNIKPRKVIFFDSFVLEEDPCTAETVYCISVEDEENFITHAGVLHNCSPVISFSPKIQYTMDQALTGTSGIQPGSLQPKMSREVGPNPCFEKQKVEMRKISYRQGYQTTWTLSDTDWDIYRDQAADIAAKNRMRNQHANILSPPFTGELRIQGDPSFNDPIMLIGHYVTLVYMNPFRVGVQSDGCEWLALGDCNKYISSSNWRVAGCYHEIKEGSFTTTLNLGIVMPGLDAPPTQTVGALPPAAGGLPGPTGVRK